MMVQMVKAMAIFCLFLIPACSQKEPRKSDEHQNVEQFEQEVQEAVDSGDVDGLLALTYTYDTPPELVKIMRQSLTLCGVGKAQAWRMQTFAFDEYSPKVDLPGSFQGRSLVWAFQPTHWIVLEPKKPASQGELEVELTLAVAEKDGTWWIVGPKYGKPEVRDPRYGKSKVRDPKPNPVPLGRELSKVPEVSLVRVKAARQGWFGFGESRNTLVQLKCVGSSLSLILNRLSREGHKFRGLEKLPAGYYALSVRGLPRPTKEAFELCAKAYEKAFGLQISVGELHWPAYQLEIPDILPADIRPAKDTDYRGFRSCLRGYEVGQYTFSQFAKWLQKRLKKQVSLSNPPDGKYTFDIKCDTFDNDTILDWLSECGIEVRETKVLRPTVLIESAKP